MKALLADREVYFHCILRHHTVILATTLATYLKLQQRQFSSDVHVRCTAKR